MKSILTIRVESEAPVSQGTADELAREVVRQLQNVTSLPAAAVAHVKESRSHDEVVSDTEHV